MGRVILIVRPESPLTCLVAGARRPQRIALTRRLTRLNRVLPLREVCASFALIYLMIRWKFRYNQNGRQAAGLERRPKRVRAHANFLMG